MSVKSVCLVEVRTLIEVGEAASGIDVDENSMLMSTKEEQKRLWRRAAVAGISSLFLIGALISCGGDEIGQPSGRQAVQQVVEPTRPVIVLPTIVPTATQVPRVRVTETDMGEDWPLTVSSGWVSVRNCRPLPSGTGKICERLFTTEDGRDYGLNGIAIGAGYPDIAEIAKFTDGVYHSGLWELSKIAANMYK